MTKCEDLNSYISKEIFEYLNRIYYSDCVVEFEQSYDGINWTEEREFIFLRDKEIYMTDWNEGQHFIRNLKVCHFNQMLFPVLSAEG